MSGLLLALLLTPPLSAQTPPQALFPGLIGEELREAIVGTYAPGFALSLEESKDTLYAVIENEEQAGIVGAECLYTGYFVSFDCHPSCDPSQDVYNDGAGLSQEHTWPRSEGAGSGLFERDLHHLFPSRNAVNGARGNLPFGESPDAETSAWHYLDQSQSVPPPLTTRDLWSERLSSALFEPREGREGDVARAVMYAYAVYGPDGSGQANPSFWEEMRPYLLAWHRADPATADDLARSDRVSRYQTTISGEPALNPFVVDSSLAARAFYPETLPSSTEPSTVGEPSLTLDVAGSNPFRDWTALTLTAVAPVRVRVDVYDTLGRRAALLHDGPLSAGSHTFPLQGAALPAGVYAVQAHAEDGQTVSQLLIIAR